MSKRNFMRKQKEKLYSVWDSIPLIFHLSPLPSAMLVLLTAFGNGIVPISVYITTGFIDSSQDYILGLASFRAVVITLVLFLLYNVADWIWQSLLSLCETRINNNIRLKWVPTLVERRAQLEYQYIEDEETCNLINRIDPYRFQQMFYDLISFVGFCIKLFGVLLILATKIWWGALLIVFFSFPLLYISYRSGRANYQASVSVSQQERRVNYLGSLINNRDSASERTLFQSIPYLLDEWEREYNRILRVTLKTKLQWDLRQKMSSVAIIVLTLVIMLTLLFPTLSGDISIGSYISLVSVCSQLAFKMQGYFIGNLEKISNSNEYCKDFSRFLQLDRNTEYTEKPIFHISLDKIEFRDVHFTYPGTNTEILKGISFTLFPNRHYALVGKNGCGKSTIVKLLLRLYKVDSGEILINGKNINDWKYQELVGFFSVVYQDFTQYQMTFQENLTIGYPDEMEPEKRDIETLIDKVQLTSVAGALPQGLRTPLGKIYEDGLELSGGEWQKIAIGRSLYRPSQVLIMDEPTAALSPKAEALMYENYQSMMKEKATLFISHRLGATKLADTVLVIDEGVVKEHGSRDELIKKGGIFYEMFNSQKEWYQ